MEIGVEENIVVRSREGCGVREGIRMNDEDLEMVLSLRGRGNLDKSFRR